MIIQKNIPLNNFTTYRVGGTADYFLHARTRNDIIYGVRYAKDNNLQLMILGKGANVLISDNGYRGLVIKNDYTTFFHESWESVQGTWLQWIRAASGALIEDIIPYTAERGLSGFEHYVMIPSTVGGALWQNLHFLSPDRLRTVFISEMVHHVYTVNTATGSEHFFYGDQMGFGYDASILHNGNHVVLEAVFQVSMSTPNEVNSVLAANKLWRTERHPDVTIDYSCGSVFKKVYLDGEWLPAAKFIDSCGLKGFGYGGAQVSLKHPNFITHKGGATAQDIMNTIRHVQKVVRGTTGILLEPEIRFIGEFL